MQKIKEAVFLQNIIPRPVGHIRYAVFLLSFLIARIPVWFIIFAAFFFNNAVTFSQGVYLIISILICRSFVESELAGGKYALSYFTAMRVGRIFTSLALYSIVFAVIIYIIAPHSDIFGKISLLISIILMPFIFSNNERNVYYKGYYTPIVIKASVTFLWFYLGFIPDGILMNILIIITIYALEFYNLRYNRPLGILPNQNSLKD